MVHLIIWGQIYCFWLIVGFANVQGPKIYILYMCVCVLLGWGRCSSGWYIQGRNSSLFYVTSYPVRLIKGHRLIRALCQLCYWIHSKLLWGDTVRKDIETFSMLLYYSYKQKIFWHKFEGCCPLPPRPSRNYARHFNNWFGLSCHFSFNFP